MLDTWKTIIQTMFRLFPFPTKTGLRTIGRPGPDSPVFVTSNFDLTVRRVTRALQGLDCYLLVANSKGINVWCAAGGGMFNAHSVISVLKTSRIGEKVAHRTLILPQLSAPGIDVARVKRETGWHCKFGPVYARDIPAYVAARYKKTEGMCRARFPLCDRLEMAVMVAAPLSILAGIPVAIFSAHTLPGVLALVWSFTVLLFAFYHPVMRILPGSVGLVKTLVLGLVGAAGVAAYGLTVGGWTPGAVVSWSLGILGVALALGFDLEGATPLTAGTTMAYWGRKWPVILDIFSRFGIEHEQYFTVQVDSQRCKGCKTCAQVCPKGVFEFYRLNSKQKSRVAAIDSCERCTACVKQCPNNAILADPPIKRFA
jgi:NAD-dependent dihydropyrimidine dehydrogenase PreA subunit